jgi:hypothetical protein
MNILLKISPLIGFFVSLNSLAKDFSFPTAVAGFVDFSASNRSLFFENTNSLWISENGANPEPVGTFPSDAGCNTQSQDPSFAANGMVLAGNVMASTTAVCLIDSASKSVRKVADLSLPIGTFSLAHLGDSNNTTYFVSNSMDLNSPELGFLTLIEVKLQSGGGSSFAFVATRPFLTNLPDASGGLTRVGSDFYLTSAVFNGDNSVYKFDVKQLLDAAEKGDKLDFSKVTGAPLVSFPGLSFFLLSDGSQFYFDNGAFGESLVVKPNAGILRSFAPGSTCKVVGFVSQKWESLCGLNWKRAVALSDVF